MFYKFYKTTNASLEYYTQQNLINVGGKKTTHDKNQT